MISTIKIYWRTINSIPCFAFSIFNTFSRFSTPSGFTFSKILSVLFDKKRLCMNFADEIKSSVHEIFSELSEPAVWRGRTVDCIVSQWQNGLDLESGGFVPDASFSVKFDESGLCGELPEIGDIVSIRDAEYRITRVSSRTGRGQIEATLVPRDK